MSLERSIEQVERIETILRPSTTSTTSASVPDWKARLRAFQSQITPEERARREAQAAAEREESRRAFFQEMAELAEYRRSQGLD